MQRRSLIRPSQPSVAPSPLERPRFQDLPAEIRNAIYSFLLPQGKTIKPKVQKKFERERALERRSHQWRAIPKDKTLVLARTCKQIHDEVVGFYYASNTISFESAYDLHIYLHMIGYNRRRHITSVRVFLANPGVCEGSKLEGWRRHATMHETLKLAFDLLGDCVFLQKLYLGIQDNTLRIRYKSLPLSEFRKTGVFSAIRGLKNLDLRVREVAYCKDEWAVFHQYEATPVGIHKPVLQFDQFDLPHDEQIQEGAYLKWRTKHTAEELRTFETDLTADMQRPREVALVDTTLTSQENEVASNEESSLVTPPPLGRAEAFMRRERLSFLPDLRSIPQKVSKPSIKRWRI